MDHENSILLCGSAFEHRGGWICDPQFMETMFSSEMLAHGLGIPVEDCRTSFTVPRTGGYRIWVRTRNWTAYWSDKPTPGIFQLVVDSVAVATCGDGSSEWHWQDCGILTLSEGSHTLSVHDLTGFEGRFDSVLLTLDTEAFPGDIRDLRRSLLGLPEVPEDGGKYDFVVVGGGVAGMCAAISAARLGRKVALIQDRKVFGGNNSSEVRVGLGGRLNIGKYPALGYLLNEFGPSTKGNAREKEVYEDDKKAAAVAAESNITVFLGKRVTSVEKEESAISAVIATDTETYLETRIAGVLFADCTGDAVLGYLAGAQCVMGREAKATYNEPNAPERSDGRTLGASVQWYSELQREPSPFPDIDWGLPIDDSTVQKARRGQWYWEVGMMDDMIAQAERIRDYGMYVSYSNWSYLKNHSQFREEFSCERMQWLSYYAGKRESRRIIGDKVLTENDLRDFVIYPDGCVSTSWYIDDHEPDPENAAAFREPWLSRGRLTPLDFYPIPYRCLYSRDVRNLFMAGRDISVSHLALGTVRVMRTCAMEGEVIGMAASVCRERNCLPRDIWQKYFDDLDALMKRGTGDATKPYLQTYTLVDTTAVRSEDC